MPIGSESTFVVPLNCIEIVVRKEILSFKSTNKYAVKGNWSLVFEGQGVIDHETQGEDYANTCD